MECVKLHAARPQAAAEESWVVATDLAEALARAGQLEEAVAALKHGIRMEPYSPSLYKSLALRYITLKQYPQAKETLERHIERFPEDDFVRGLLAQVEGHATR